VIFNIVYSIFCFHFPLYFPIFFYSTFQLVRHHLDTYAGSRVAVAVLPWRYLMKIRVGGFTKLFTFVVIRGYVLNLRMKMVFLGTLYDCATATCVAVNNVEVAITRSKIIECIASLQEKRQLLLL